MDLSEHVTPRTVQAIFDHYKKARTNGHRPHLGGSQIGNPCGRALWYQFRWCDSAVFDGRMLRLFETGDREEQRIVDNLRSIGVTVWDKDPETGKQIRFEECGGHFALSLDGVGQGFLESGQPHTLEFKTMNEKNFRALERDGLEKAKPIYYAQCQIGMHLSEIDRCAFIAVNKNTDEIYMERVKRDMAIGLQLVAKAREIIFTDKPPQKLNSDPSYYMCKFCDYRHVCHEGRPPEVNCRTCAHATPEQDGTWTCALDRSFGTACEQHLFNPYAMPWELSDAGPDWIEYTTQDGEVIRNHYGNSQSIRDAWVPF